MPKSRTVVELESMAVRERPMRRRLQAASSTGEALAMLIRRGFRPLETRPDLPFPDDLEREVADPFSELLGHYAFRLFFRGAIQKPHGFTPRETTRFVTGAQARAYALGTAPGERTGFLGIGRWR